MGKIAIDIAFLLPKEMEDICININKTHQRIRPLGKNDYRPHITLVMGIIDGEDMPSVQDCLNKLKINSLNLIVDKIKYRETPEGNKSAFEVVNIPELQTLHETLSNEIKQYLQKGANVEMLYKGDETGMAESTQLWLDNFIDKTAFENYWPHITLGCYDAKTNLPINFQVNTIALCHAGDGVTCRHILFEKTF